MQPGMLVRLPWVRPKRQRRAVWPPLVPSPVKSTSGVGGWCGLPSPDFWALGSSPFFVFSCHVRSSNPPPCSRSVTLRTTPSASIPNGSRSTASGWTERRVACSSFTLAARMKASENKFKCPCHGSGYDSEGVNFEGPAPRPMGRAHVELAPDGQIIVDTSRLYQWPKGQPSHFSDPGSFLQV
ncbi:MAG: hypothetical protein DMG56_18400, partial [Acidobacteria bacterium]